MNPFRIAGVVQPPFFTNRAAEVARVRVALSEPTAKLLVYGPRRMGKTSLLRLAMARDAMRGGLSCLADLSTASSPVDVANRVLSAATAVIGRRWVEVMQELPRRLGLSLRLGLDPATQLPTVSIEAGIREEPIEAQRQTLVQALDTLNGLMADRSAHLAVVLDEFQEIHRFGGEAAEWHLRGAMQNHQHLSYVVAGSKPHLIHRMVSDGRAFYKLFDILELGALDAEHLTRWIDDRLAVHGVASGGAGAEMVRLAGPRTRDIVQLARRTFELGRSGGLADASVVGQAFVDVVQSEDGPLRALWDGLTVRQQNVLRACASGTEMLTGADTIRRFSLKSSAAATQAAARFTEDGMLEQVGPGHYRLDSPFMRGWLIMNTLPDMGVYLPATHMG
jgi:hypothetical protein